MSEEIKDHLSNSDNWIRLLLVILFTCVFWLGAWVLCFVAALGLLILLVTGERNDNLSRFGAQLSQYLSNIMAYATLNSDEQPFPFGGWPADEEQAPEPAPEPVPVAPSAPPTAKEPAPAAPPASPPAAKKTTTKAKKKTTRKKTAKKKVTKKVSKKS
jgi:hypothetical protein